MGRCSTRFDKSDVKHFPIIYLACLGEGWSPLTNKQITLHIGELEVCFACFFNILERGFAIEGNHGQWIREYFWHLPSTNEERRYTVRNSNPGDSALLFPVRFLTTFALSPSQSCFFRLDILQNHRYCLARGTWHKHKPKVHCGISKVEMSDGLWPLWAYGSHEPRAFFFLNF